MSIYSCFPNLTPHFSFLTSSLHHSRCLSLQFLFSQLLFLLLALFEGLLPSSYLRPVLCSSFWAKTKNRSVLLLRRPFPTLLLNSDSWHFGIRVRQDQRFSDSSYFGGSKFRKTPFRLRQSRLKREIRCFSSTCNPIMGNLVILQAWLAQTTGLAISVAFSGWFRHWGHIARILLNWRANWVNW